MILNHFQRPSRALLATTLAAASIGATCLVATPTMGSPASASAMPSAARAAATATAVKIGPRRHALDGTNQARDTTDLVQYGPRNGSRTGTNRYGTEVAIVHRKITKIERRVGNMVIPNGGYVLSGHGTSGRWLNKNARVGASVRRVWDTTPGPTPNPTPTPGDSYGRVLARVAGLTHYYPLNAANRARDAVGNVDGSVKGSGVTFTKRGAVLTGRGFVELPDHNDFSVATRGGLTVLVDATVRNWRGAGASEYVHWMGKGVPGAHEWTFRHYVQGGSGEAGSRQGRVSFYHFNPAGGLGAGSYFQDPMTNAEQVVGATANTRQVQMYKNGALRDTDALSGYSVVPRNTTTPVRIGSRGDNTGFLVGRVRRVAFFNRVLTGAEMQRLSAAARK